MTNGDCFDLCVNDLKMAVPSEDMGFCSSEDYLENELHSPTDSSEDSVEVKVSTISLSNKRKRIEPRKTPETFTGPLKKRMCLKVKAEINESHPFRPWSPTPKKLDEPITVKSETTVDVKREEAANFHLPKIEYQSKVEENVEPTFGPYFRPPSPINFFQQSEPVPLVKKREDIPIVCEEMRVPIHPQIQSLSTAETERLILKSTEMFPSLQNSIPSTSKKSSEIPRREQRNYKNMTRERRIEANARERTRVHTISAAFDTLRRSVPSYSHNQKLSKLSVLRIACSYIMTLSTILNDESDSEPSTSECVDLVTKTIQREGKLRKKKDDND